MKHCVIILLLMVLAVGCGKKEEVAATEESSAPISAEQNARIEAELVPPPTATAKPDAPAAERLNGAVHPQLTAQLHMYIERTGKVPETIYEFANTAVDTMPPAPAGMKYVIDPVDKAVKAVPK